MTPALAVVVPTLGRDASVERLLVSLRGQLREGDELVLVDQNPDDRLAPILQRVADLAPRRIRAAARGASHARNVGLAATAAALVWFPDDDCWIPPGLLDRIRAAMAAEAGIDMLSGRVEDGSGNPAMGRWPATALTGDRGNIWRIAIEFTVVYRRSVFARTGGFREDLGVGAGTPWGAGEGQDLLLRALAAGLRIEYRPELVFLHPDKFLPDDAASLAKAASYARGVGYVMGSHGYGWIAFAPHVLKPLAGVLLHAACGRTGRVRYYLGQAVNRWRGWRAGRRHPAGHRQAWP